MRKKRDILNRVTDSPAKRPWIVVVDTRAQGPDGSGVGTEKTDNQLHQGRRAATAFAENGLSERKHQRDIFEGKHVAAAQ